jgi:integrase/recombinase XerD
MTPPTPEPGPSFSSPLASALRRFLEFKRAAGYRYREEAGALARLDRFLSTHLVVDDPVISLDVIRAYVARRGRESDSTQGNRVSLIRQFCRFLALEQPRTAIPGSRFLGIARRTFLPRILTREEGRRFLQACGTLAPGRCSPLRPTVLGTVLVLLYLTGLRAGEALRLTDADVDLDTAVLRVRDTKFGKSRLVPMASDVATRLHHCRAAVVRHFGPRAPDAPFFPTRSGGQYSIHALGAAFHQVLVAAGVPRWSGGRSLRLHDLRHSFVAIRLLLWCEQHADLGARLPGLATYLGHVSLRSTQRYVQLSPDLVEEVVRRHEARFGYLITDRRPS